MAQHFLHFSASQVHVDPAPAEANHTEGDLEICDTRDMGRRRLTASAHSVNSAVRAGQPTMFHSSLKWQKISQVE